MRIPFRTRQENPVTQDTSTPPAAQIAEHGPGCPCLEDRSPGRWCEVCGTHGSHHTDRHDLMHALPFPDRRYDVLFASFTCDASCGKTHEGYSVLTYAPTVTAAQEKAVARLLDADRGHRPTALPVPVETVLDY